jgi:serine/threonine protein kinase
MTRFRERSEEFELLWPAVGDELFHFRVRRELGRGAFARVFLAEQADLAGRLVVLKVSALDDDEAQTLAQLQHTNIVPIYSVHEDTRLGLRAVCMPYFGGASLSDVLQRLWERTGRPTHGAQLVAALEQVQAQAPPATEAFLPRAAGQTPLQMLGRLSYVRAVAWIVARLAEGLQHAHERGVLHRDIKPSNTLLGADGQPMLLDFNLARSAHHDEACSSAIRGGTVAYMAPEHLRALVTRDPRFDRQVDHRSDIYSLGMVLYEMLAREGPFEQEGSYSVLPALIELMALERGRALPSLRPKRPDASWALESIVRKCLAPEPEQRYQQASHLAEDLRCFLDDRTLRHAPELSLVERLRKWARRHPRLTSIGSVATVAAALLAGTEP